MVLSTTSSFHFQLYRWRSVSDTFPALLLVSIPSPTFSNAVHTKGISFSISSSIGPISFRLSLSLRIASNPAIDNALSDFNLAISATASSSFSTSLVLSICANLLWKTLLIFLLSAVRSSVITTPENVCLREVFGRPHSGCLYLFRALPTAAIILPCTLSKLGFLSPSNGLNTFPRRIKSSGNPISPLLSPK